MKIKKTALCTLILLSIGYLVGCTRIIHHPDPFYNVGSYDDFPRNHLPLIKPIEATRERSSFPWKVNLMPHGPWVSVPNSQDEYCFCQIEELEKFAVENGVIMAYSPYIDEQANAYIQDNFYHWFVIIPAQEITKGFLTEAEFLQYIGAMGIESPNWQTPDDAFDTFMKTGCLDWIPDCK